MKKLILFIFLIGCSNYNINIVGINSNLFKERDWVRVGAGVISSFLVHEGSHLLFAEIYGGGHFDGYVIMEDYYNQSHSTQQMFHRSGFLGQLVVGGVLTAIPPTRYSDFTLGFNSFTTINTCIYTITGGHNGQYSDIKNLDNGILEGAVYTGIAGVLTFFNLEE